MLPDLSKALLNPDLFDIKQTPLNVPMITPIINKSNKKDHDTYKRIEGIVGFGGDDSELQMFRRSGSSDIKF